MRCSNTDLGSFEVPCSSPKSYLLLSLTVRRDCLLQVAPATDPSANRIERSLLFPTSSNTVFFEYTRLIASEPLLVMEDDRACL